MHHRRQGVGSVEDEDEEGPGQNAGRGRKREPAPQAQARDPIGGQHHEDEIDHQRPGLRLVGGDEERASHGAEQAERGEDRAMQRGRDHGEDRDEAEQDEGRRRADQVVERIGRIGRGEGAAGSGRGEDRGHVRARNAGQDESRSRRRSHSPAPIRARAKRPPKRDAGRGAEQVLLDGIAHEEDPAERQRHAADPDRPAGAELLLEILARRRRLRGCGLDGRDGDGRPGRFDGQIRFGGDGGLFDGRLGRGCRRRFRCRGGRLDAGLSLRPIDLRDAAIALLQDLELAACREAEDQPRDGADRNAEHQQGEEGSFPRDGLGLFQRAAVPDGIG